MLEKYNSINQKEFGTEEIKGIPKSEKDQKELIVPATNLEDNARCVPVGTILITPDGRNKKRERFKGKSEFIKFRCSIYEKEIKERLSDEQIDIYKTLIKFHNNFKSIGNMFRKKDPKLTSAIYKLADEIKIHLQNLNR